MHSTRLLVSQWCLRIARFGADTILLVAAAAAVPMMIVFLSSDVPGSNDTGLISTAWLIVAGAVAGTTLVSLQRHPTRVLGLVPLGATGCFVLLALAALQQAIAGWLCVLLGVTAGLALVPLLRTAARGRAWLFLAALVAGLVLDRWLFAGAWLWPLAGLAGGGAALAWWALLRDAYDQAIEWIAWPFFRIRGQGPGLASIPRTGPLLVIANHTAWFDPVWLGKVLPRRLTGMLTSVFFDLPVLHFLATKVVHAIRVEQSRYRREAPELAQAIAALDRGEAVLLFPEGQMRKKEEKPLHPFGRGVWHILHERPNTPVVACWIEGGWGSFTSYKDGPPTKHKRFDRWRRIDVAVTGPEVLDHGLLEDHRATRNYLMQKVSEARRCLGLEPLARQELAAAEKSDNLPQ